MPSVNDPRGYGRDHRQLRAQLRRTVEAGEVICARCFVLIAPPGEPCPRCGREVARGRPSPGQCCWDLGHDDVDRTLYTGAEHGCCNRRAGARKGARVAARNRRVWSRQWLSS